MSPYGYPSKIQIQTINLCNFKCPLCPYPVVSEGRRAQRLSRDILERIVADTRAAGRRVVLCLMLQNEPLLDRRFLALARWLHDECDDVITSLATVTNGSALTGSLLDALAELPRFHLTVSVNATDAAQYQQVNGVDRFERLVSLLEGWTGPRQRVRLSYLALAGQEDRARRFLERWTPSGYAVRLVPVMSRAGTIEISGALRLQSDDFGHCHYPVDTLNVRVDGEVILCCNDWEHSETFGSLQHASVSDIWNSPRLRELREAAMGGWLREASTACRGCDYPMRSALRAQLGKSILSSRSLSGPYRIVPHTAELREASGTPLAHLVVDLCSDGLAVVAVEDPAGVVPGSSLQLTPRIAYSGLFSFGSFAGRAVPVTVTAIQAGPPTLLTLSVDTSHPAAAVWSWYCADWTPPPQPEMRAHSHSPR